MHDDGCVKDGQLMLKIMFRTINYLFLTGYWPRITYIALLCDAIQSFKSTKAKWLCVDGDRIQNSAYTTCDATKPAE